MSDERLKRPAGAEVRGETRLTETLIKEGDPSTSDDVRRESLNDEWDYNALPDPPDHPGFHRCWLSTTNGSDSIMRRQRLGYVPVKAADLGKEWERTGIQNGEFAGCVAVNEMILFEIPEARYQGIMRKFHHDAPNEEEGRLRSQLDAARQGLGTGQQLVAEVGDGTASLGSARPAPRAFT